MGGIHIFCGDFEGEDKSCSAITGVIGGVLSLHPDAKTVAILDPIGQHFGDCCDEPVSLSPEEASIIAPWIGQYHERLISHFGGIKNPDTAMALAAENEPDPSAAKYGEGLGWQLLCTTDMLKACAAAAETGKCIMITYL